MGFDETSKMLGVCEEEQANVGKEFFNFFFFKQTIWYPDISAESEIWTLVWVMDKKEIRKQEEYVWLPCQATPFIILIRRSDRK